MLLRSIFLGEEEDNMSTILETIKVNAYERPKYTRYELGHLVFNKRVESNLSIQEVATNFGVEPSLWENIESGSRIFNVKIYKIIERFLNKPMAELLEKECDNRELVSFRAQNHTSKEILEAVEIANAIFHEVVIQEKISV